MITLIGSTRVPQEAGFPQRFRLRIPKLPMYFTGTGDLVAALLLARTADMPGRLTQAVELAIASVQGAAAACASRRRSQRQGGLRRVPRARCLTVGDSSPARRRAGEHGGGDRGGRGRDGGGGGAGAEARSEPGGDQEPGPQVQVRAAVVGAGEGLLMFLRRADDLRVGSRRCSSDDGGMSPCLSQKTTTTDNS